MVAEKGSMVYLASEQAAIEIVCPDAQNIRAVDGGVPFVVQLDEVAARKRNESAENEPAVSSRRVHKIDSVSAKRKEA
jgi:hypothetical protein